MEIPNYMDHATLETNVKNIVKLLEELAVQAAQAKRDRERIPGDLFVGRGDEVGPAPPPDYKEFHELDSGPTDLEWNIDAYGMAAYMATAVTHATGALIKIAEGQERICKSLERLELITQGTTEYMDPMCTWVHVSADILSDIRESLKSK